jgi:hypothetical protein
MKIKDSTMTNLILVLFSLCAIENSYVSGVKWFSIVVLVFWYLNSKYYWITVHNPSGHPSDQPKE